MKKIILIIIIVVLVVLGIWYFTARKEFIPEETMEPEQQTEESRQEATINQNENFQIILGANPTTGYQWQVDFDEEFVKLTDRQYAPSGDLIGSGGQELFVFLAAKQGQTEITFSYMRPWENVDPIAREIYEVTITPPDSVSGESTIPGWKSYMDNTLKFKIDHPAEMNITDMGGQVNFSVWGPTQTGQTELFDGISFTVFRRTYEQSNLREVVEIQRQADMNLGSADEIEEFILNAMIGYYYTGEGLGLFTNIFIDVGTGETFIISYAVPDPQNQGFQQTVNTMLSTLQLIK